MGMSKESISIKTLIKDAFSGIGPLGWLFLLLKPANKGVEMLGEIDLFETYGGSIGRFLDTGWGTLTSIIIGTLIIGYAIYKRIYESETVIMPQKSTAWKFKLEPLHLITLGIIITGCGVVWQYYKGFETAHKAKLETVSTIPTPSYPSLTEEDKQFRFGLRTFILSDLQEQANNFGQLAGRLANTDSNTVFVKDKETTIAAGALLEKVLRATYYDPWDSLSKQANTTIETMDVKAVIEKVKLYFKAYTDAQNDLWNFLGGSDDFSAGGILARRFL